MFGPKRLVLISYISSFIFRCWYVLPSVLSLFFTFCLMLHFTRVFGLAMPFGHSRECCNSVYPRKTNFFFIVGPPQFLNEASNHTFVFPPLCGHHTRDYYIVVCFVVFGALVPKRNFVPFNLAVPIIYFVCT